MAHSTTIVAFLAVFFGAGVLFLFFNLLLGYFVRASNPHEEKTEIYECGEPTIGTGFVQFDLRFYVVALLFLVFDVEMAFFFPWATVFGKAVHLMSEQVVLVQAAEQPGLPAVLTAEGRGLLMEFGFAQPQAPTANELGQPIATAAEAEGVLRRTARTLAGVAIADIAVFFGVLLVGFAYVWKRGDLNWVRAITRQTAVELGPSGEAREEEPILTA